MGLDNTSWVHWPSLALSNPILQERPTKAFKHLLEKFFCHVKEGLLWNTFKHYWMGKKKQFSFCTLLQFMSKDIGRLVVPQDKRKAGTPWWWLLTSIRFTFLGMLWEWILEHRSLTSWSLTLWGMTTIGIVSSSGLTLLPSGNLVHLQLLTIHSIKQS
jgi:hypothetical protein